jgi:hypothetical protein
MKAGNLMTAAAIMFALANAESKAASAMLSLAIHSGKFRHRGKGRGGVVHNHIGKTSRCATETGARAAARRLRKVHMGNPYKQLARQWWEVPA